MKRIFLILLAFSATTLTIAQTTEYNKEIVTRAFEIGGTADVDRMHEVFAENYTRHCQATPGVNITSLDQFKHWVQINEDAMPDQHITVHRLVAEDNYVAFWATYHGTQTGQMGPHPPLGNKASIDFAGMHRLENGKIAESWLSWDNVAFLTQLGHMGR